MPRLYVETSIISFLTARPSRDLLLAANQQLTREWWESRRADFELYASELVRVEAMEGDADAAARRVEALNELVVLNITDEAVTLASDLMRESPLPTRADADALHIALATVHGMDFLLTWNCRHIANAAIHPLVSAVCRSKGYEPPIICTPPELLER